MTDIGREIGEAPPVPELLKWVSKRIPSAMRYSTICKVAITYHDQIYGDPEAVELPSQIVHALRVGNEVVGRVHIAYTEKHDFLDEESALLGGTANRLSSYLETRHLIDQVQQRAIELEDTTAFLDSIFDNLPVMVFVKEAKELRHIRWNKTGLELIGRTTEEMIGKNDYDFFPKEEADFFAAKDRETLEKGELVEIPEEPIQTADGDTRWLYTRKTPVYSVDGQPRYLLGISVDITEQKRAQAEREQLLTEMQQSQELLRSIIDATPDWIFVKDRDHRHHLVNKSYAEAMHLSPDDFLGKNDLEVGFPEYIVKGDPERGIRGFWTDDNQVMNSGEPLANPHVVVSVDDEERIFDDIKIPLRDAEGEVWGVLGMGRDVTERERLLEEVQAAYRQYVAQEWGQFLTEQRQGHWHIEHQSGALPHQPGRNGDDGTAISTPITLRGQVIGSLNLEDMDPERKWSDEEKALLESVSEQLAQTVENLRLFENTQQRASREQLTREITDKMRAAPDVDAIIQTGLTELTRALGVSRSYVKLSPKLEQDQSTQ